METVDLTSPGYWESDANDIRLNPAVSLDRPGVESGLRERGIRSAVVVATSGSEGYPKYVVLGKEAILTSARAVNAHCGVTENDVWLGALSTFHVGGLGVYARAFLSRSRVLPFSWDSWTRDGKAFLEGVGEATITSLTPVHLFDLVEAGVPCPGTLRGVFIGGGALSGELAGRARALGWPLWPTFGMTEASSQIATSLDGNHEWLPILPHWDCRIVETGRLGIRGPSLMAGFFSCGGSGALEWHPVGDGECYETGDRACIEDGKLKPLGRADDQVKILGELVFPGKLGAALAKELECVAWVWAISDERRGARLFGALEKAETGRDRDAFLRWNESLPPFERLERIFWVPEFPRTELGKIDLRALRELPE